MLNFPQQISEFVSCYNFYVFYKYVNAFHIQNGLHRLSENGVRFKICSLDMWGQWE